MANIFDTIIIGAGPIGISCAIEAKLNNLKYLIIEKGCITNSIYNYPTNMTFFSTSSNIEIGNIPFVSHNIKPTRKEALEYYRRVVQSYNLKINTYEKVIEINELSNEFKIITDKNSYLSRNVILAIGFFDYPNMLRVAGENLPKVRHYYTEPHPYAFQKVAVIGAKNSAVDVALETFRVGAEVTMIIRENEISPSVKYWVKPDIENRIKEGSIKAYFNSNVINISDKKITIQTPTEIINIENDFVFAMTGYHPDFDFLKKIGVNFSAAKIPYYNPDSFETNIKGIYLAGVVCGGINTSDWFIENSLDHSEKIIKNIKKVLQNIFSN